MYSGLTTKAARQLVYETALANNIKRLSQWNDNKSAGKEWLVDFMKRHPYLSIRTPEATSIARATAFNRHNINCFFYILQERMGSLNVQARQIFNLDETGFTTVQGMPKVITSKGTKQVGQMTSRERGELVTVCAIVSGTGHALPPTFVFSRKRFQPHMLNNAPAGSLGLVSDNGWMTSEKFLSVLEHFVEYVQPSESNPAILIMGNHERHLSLPALEYAKRHHIHIITLVPHTSNKTQPLDRTVFGPVKKLYNDAAVSWMMHHPGQTITIYNVTELVRDVWLRGATPMKIVSGFRAAGIWPFDRNVFPDDYFAPSEVTDRPDPTNNGLPMAGPSGDAPEQCNDHEDQRTLLHLTWPPSVSLLSKSNHHSYHLNSSKAPPRTVNGRGRGRRRGTCMLATSSPHLKRKRLEKQTKESSRENTVQKVLFAVADDSDDDIGIQDIVNADMSVSSDNDEEMNAFVLGEVSEVQVKVFVVCEYGGQKSSLFYVGMVSKGVDDEGDIEVNFFRKSGKVKGKFIKPDVEEIVSVPLNHVKGKLTRASVSGTTKRTQNTYFFNEDLSQLNVN